MTAVMQQGANPERGELRLRITRTWIAYPDNLFIVTFDAMLSDTIRQVVSHAGIDYASLSIINRLLLSRFRCPLCGSLPIYFLDLKYLNKARCGKCSTVIGLKNSGKYGKLKKRIAILTCSAIDDMLALDKDLNQHALDELVALPYSNAST
jgi:hypothetical protein